MNEWLLVALGGLLIAANAVFVASEFALVTLDPGVVDRQVDARNDWRARAVRRALGRMSTQLSSAQVGITVTSIVFGFTTQPVLATMLTGPLERTFAGAAAAGLAATTSLVLVNVLQMIFGELAPKNLALSRPMPTARVVAPLQIAFTVALHPVIALMNNSANALLRRMGIEPREGLSGGRSPQELAALVRRSADLGTLDEGVARLLTNSIELDTLTALDTMTDRTRVVAVRREDDAADVVATARRTGHSRFPVIGDTHDDVLGLVHVRRAVAVPFERRGEVPVTALMDPAPRVPETVTLGPLLVELRELGMQMAVVVDEYGGTSGVVTLEDVVEELVGEVADEHDVRGVGVHRGPSGTWSVPGLLRPDELAEQTGLLVPEEVGYETLGGLVMARLGRVPEVGDLVEVGDVVLRVTAMDGRRVDRLLVRVQEAR